MGSLNKMNPVMDSLNKLDHLKDGKRFKFNVEQCKSLCSYMSDKLSPYTENSNVRNAPFGDWRERVWRESLERAWKEVNRTVKEAETYLKHCSTDNGLLKCFILADTGEAFALHMHDFVWSLVCLELAVNRWTDELDGIVHLRIQNVTYKFVGEMSSLHLKQFACKFQDYWHLLMACNQTAATAGLGNQKNEIGILSFIERKVIEATMNECKIESATGICWLQIPPKDLIRKRIIGEGSFGAVYEGSWLGHKVAVKDIPIGARDLFDKETTVLSKLQSPFIVQLIGICVEKSHCCIVMELVSTSLDKILTKSGGRAPLALPVAVDMMLQISRGMEYLHSQGIMHMDLKSSNVLIEPSEVPKFRKQGYGRVKLCDFGMASLRLSSFRCEDPKGTCYWRAPEAFPFPIEKLLPEIDTLEEYTYKADVYSFAMTCYEILTGKQPFLDVLPKDLYRTIVRGGRPVLTRSSCPAVLADYISECWETDPSRRPSFAQISSFLRAMKQIILTMDDALSYGDHLTLRDACLELVTSKDEGFDESPADEKLELISGLLETIPLHMKRRYNMYVLGLVPSLKSQKHTFVLLNMNNSFELDDILGSNLEILGKGSLGTAYRANLLDLSLAIKRLSKDTTYVGNERDFEERLQALGGLKHTNLVSLQAYCISKDEKLLIYNYLPNGSLYSLLHIEREPLAWFKRVKIALDVASVLAFLHDSGIVHGDVKSSNILLNEEGNACLADACLADLAESPSAAKNSSIHITPECFISGKLSKESDVYSFGVVLMELVSGQDPSSFRDEFPTDEVGDVRLRREWRDIRKNMLELAMLCSSPHVDVRPSMSTVFESIRGMTAGLNRHAPSF